MRHVIASIAALVMGAAVIVSAPQSAAHGATRAADARAAIDAAMAHARLNGMTYEIRGEIRQRDARGDVAVVVSGRTVQQLLLQDGDLLRLLEPAPRSSSRPRISREVREAYGIGTSAYIANAVDPGEQDSLRSWFDPFSAFEGMTEADVVVDAAGRARQITVNGEVAVRVLRWSAPLAVRPGADRILSADTAATAAGVERSGHFVYGLVDQLASIAGAQPSYTEARVPTLRRVARHTGWQARESVGGVTITVTDALGATWDVALIAQRTGVRMRTFALAAHPAPMSQAEAEARHSLGVMAMGQADLMSCPMSCRTTGKPAPLSIATAQEQMLARLRSIGITGQTPGPDYPSVGKDMTGSFGLVASGKRLGGSVALATGGLCLVIPITGPGVVPRPTSFLATPGRIGPWGTCQA